MATDTTSHASHARPRTPGDEAPEVPAPTPVASPASAMPLPAPPPEPWPGHPRGEPGGLYRLTIEQYGKMVEVGVFDDDDRVELLDGLLVRKMGKNPPHVTSKKLVIELLSRILPPGWHVDVEDPLALPGGGGVPDSMPEPDIAVLRGGIRDYADRTPGPADVALVVEVADSSLRKDRRGPARYARAGIPVAWIVNLQANALEVYTSPSGPVPEPSYASLSTFNADSSLILSIEGRELGPIAVADLLP